MNETCLTRVYFTKGSSAGVESGVLNKVLKRRRRSLRVVATPPRPPRFVACFTARRYRGSEENNSLFD